MTVLDLTPSHLTREGRAIRARLIRIARSPAVELYTAATIMAWLGYTFAMQIGV